MWEVWRASFGAVVILGVQGVSLAQSSGARGGSPATTQVLVLIGVGVLVVLVAGVVIMRLRRGVNESDRNAGAGTMEDIRRMHACGAISQAEYDALRRATAQRASSAMSGGRSASASSRAGADVQARSPERGGAQRELRAKSPVEKPADNTAGDNEIRAKPGFDLLGRPLPKSPPE